MSFALSRPDKVVVKVCDALGRIVGTFHMGQLGAGRHELFFDSAILSPGIYYYRIRAGSSEAVGSMLVAR
jgi:hypothetical protein